MTFLYAPDKCSRSAWRTSTLGPCSTFLDSLLGLRASGKNRSYGPGVVFLAGFLLWVACFGQRAGRRIQSGGGSKPIN